MALAWCVVRRSASKFASVYGGRVRSISAVANRASLARNPSSIRPFVSRALNYSTAIDRISSEQTLIRVIDSEINSALQSDNIDSVKFSPFLLKSIVSKGLQFMQFILRRYLSLFFYHWDCLVDAILLGFGWEQDEEMTPGSFPFRIEDKPGNQNVTLTRDYNGEHIKVVVSMPSLVSDENDDDDDDDEGPSNESSIPLVVTVTKKSGLTLEFSCMAFPDEIAIDALSVKHPGDSLEDQLANEGPDFEDLDENLKKTFYKFLEIRGVKASTTNFLHEYMTRKVNREYFLWLKNVKEFMEQ
jgi:complement component 1 Q subcomponent-binding protein